MNNFDKDFNRVKTGMGIASFVFVMLWLAMVSCIIVFAFTVITDPGSVGRFFGEIVAGFNSTIK
jgi:hypothetical protein